MSEQIEQFKCEVQNSSESSESDVSNSNSSYQSTAYAYPNYTYPVENQMTNYFQYDPAVYNNYYNQYQYYPKQENYQQQAYNPYYNSCGYQYDTNYSYSYYQAAPTNTVQKVEPETTPAVNISISSSSSASPVSTNNVSKVTKTSKKSKTQKKSSVVSLAKEPSTPADLSNLTLKLTNKSLWEKFDSHSTEMIITKQGRRMFPTLQYAFGGLESTRKYEVFVDLVLADQSSWKFQAGKWISCGPNQQQTSGKVYIHPILN